MAKRGGLLLWLAFYPDLLLSAWNGRGLERARSEDILIHIPKHTYSNTRNLTHLMKTHAQKMGYILIGNFKEKKTN